MTTRFKGLVAILSCLFQTSCFISPACYNYVYGSQPDEEQLARVTVFAEPIDGSEGRVHPTAMWAHFKRGTSVAIDRTGRLRVSDLDLLPKRCPLVSEKALGEIVELWRAALAGPGEQKTQIQAVASRYTADNRRPDGALISLTVGSPKGKSLGIVWDGRVALAEEVDEAVVGTLEAICGTSQLARSYLRRDLPDQVASRLHCSLD